MVVNSPATAPVAVDAVIDHVAVAARDRGRALQRWAHDLGGAQISGAERDGFHAAQIRYRNGTKLEVVSEGSRATFVRPFLDRYGATVHHVTLKVSDLGDAVAVLAAAGVPTVDVDHSRAEWQEGFVSPRVSGGPVVQLVSTPLSDAEWTARHGHPEREPRRDGADLLGVVLGHEDPWAGARLWQLLGATVEAHDDDTIRCWWAPGRLEVWLRRQVHPAPVGVWFGGTDARPADPVTGPSVLTSPTSSPPPPEA